MILKILITIVLMAVCVPAVGAIIGLGIGMKGKKFVYPTVLITWGTIIYMVWFRQHCWSEIDGIGQLNRLLSCQCK